MQIATWDCVRRVCRRPVVSQCHCPTENIHRLRVPAHRSPHAAHTHKWYLCAFYRTWTKKWIKMNAWNVNVFRLVSTCSGNVSECLCATVCLCVCARVDDYYDYYVWCKLQIEAHAKQLAWAYRCETSQRENTYEKKERKNGTKRNNDIFCGHSRSTVVASMQFYGETFIFIDGLGANVLYVGFCNC